MGPSRCRRCSCVSCGKYSVGPDEGGCDYGDDISARDDCQGYLSGSQLTIDLHWLM